ncbi:MAG: hypothetical protein LBD03_08935 [Methanobrevibacter sp.]|jgi:hypothetical protein|nr:hypothetical protein [Candidatus Methanovirga procula]
MMKKISAISLILLLLGSSISAVSAEWHYSYITAYDCVGNAKMYDRYGAMPVNWDFNAGNSIKIETNGWRSLHVNPKGWGNPQSDASWESVPTYIDLSPGSQYGSIDINGHE